MREWIYSIVISILITTIISIMSPEGRLGQIIKCIFSIILMLIVIMPVINPNTLDLLYLDDKFNIDEQISYDYINHVYDKKVNSLSKNCEILLDDLGIKMLVFL